MEGVGPSFQSQVTMYEEESDYGNFKLMSDNQKSYSVPHSILVCYDEHRIHGLRMSLIMHRFPPADDEEVKEDQKEIL